MQKLDERLLNAPSKSLFIINFRNLKRSYIFIYLYYFKVSIKIMSEEWKKENDENLLAKWYWQLKNSALEKPNNKLSPSALGKYSMKIYIFYHLLHLQVLYVQFLTLFFDAK